MGSVLKDTRGDEMRREAVLAKIKDEQVEPSKGKNYEGKSQKNVRARNLKKEFEFWLQYYSEGYLDAARQIGVRPDIVKGYLNGSGEYTELEQVLSKFLNTQWVINRFLPLTPTLMINDVLKQSLEDSKIGLVVAPPGTGKSFAIQQFKKKNPLVLTLNIPHGLRSPKFLYRIISYEIFKRDIGTSISAYLNILNEIRNNFLMIVVDEVQNLDRYAIEEFRNLHDKTGIGIAFFGNEFLSEELKGKRRFYEALRSRARYNSYFFERGDFTKDDILLVCRNICPEVGLKDIGFLVDQCDFFFRDVSEIMRQAVEIRERTKSEISFHLIDNIVAYSKKQGF